MTVSESKDSKLLECFKDIYPSPHAQGGLDVTKSKVHTIFAGHLVYWQLKKPFEPMFFLYQIEV